MKYFGKLKLKYNLRIYTAKVFLWYPYRKIMSYTRYGKYPLIVGIILVAAGILFTMQSNSVVGPSTSFMYDNPEWTSNGFIIIVIGVFLVLIGFTALQLKKHRRLTSNWFRAQIESFFNLDMKRAPITVFQVFSICNFYSHRC